MTHLNCMVTNKKRIQAYVSSSTYESLKSLAESRNMSLSEYVGELLQTQSVATDSNEIVTNDSSSNYVTKEQLLLMFHEFRSEIDREIIREVNRAEISWEEKATTLMSMKSEMIQIAAGSDALKESFSRYQKSKKSS